MFAVVIDEVNVKAKHVSPSVEKYISLLSSSVVHTALLSQCRIWECGSILIFPCPNMFRMSAKIAKINSVTLDMLDSFLLMMLLYLWPMLLSVVGWITVTDSIQESLSKFNVRTLQCIQNTAVGTLSNTSRYASIAPVLKKLHWLSVEDRSVFKTATLVYMLLHTEYLAPYISSYSRSYSTRHSQSGGNFLVVPKF